MSDPAPVPATKPPADLLEYLFPDPTVDVAAALFNARAKLKANPPAAFDYLPGSLGIRLQSGQMFPICADIGIPGLEQGTPVVSLTNSQNPSGAGQIGWSPSFGVTTGK